MAEYSSAAPDKADEDEDKRKKDDEDYADIVKTALEQYERALERDRVNQDEAYEDLRFRKGEQWPEKDKAERESGGHVCLTINRLPQFIRQVTGDMRQMRPSIKAVPVDSRGDPKTADVISGIIRYIENRSAARHIYTKAADTQVCAGIGHWEVTTEYASSTTFNQEIRIVGVADSVSVLWDPDAILPTREDAMFCFVPVDVTRAKFKERWPDSNAEDFGDTKFTSSGWVGDDFVRVAAYWVKKPIKRTLALLPDGSIDDLTNDDDPNKLELLKAHGARIEERDSFEVCRYLITCSQVLEKTDWPGLHIPVVPAIGEEVTIGRECYRHGVVRFARDPQRIYNYFRSAQTEVIALQPKAPFIATQDQVKNHIDQWNSANSKNWPVLLYDVDPKSPGTVPSRVAPPVSSQGITEGTLQAADDMKAVIGIYDASLGARSNETSGVAIRARQREGDVGTFVYIDNFALAIQRTGQIIVDLIPHVYDTERMVRIVGEDGKEELLEVNKPVILNGMQKTLHDVTVGAYDVTLQQGPSYSTKREEARESMTEFIRAYPPAAGLIGDLYAKAQDWPQADEIGQRLESTLPPQIQHQIAVKKAQDEGQPPPPPPEAPPNPEMMKVEADMQAKQADMQIEQMKAQADLQGRQMDAQMKQAELQQSMEIEQLKAQIAMQAAADKMELARIQGDIELQKAQVELQKAELELRKKELELLCAQQCAATAAAPDANETPQALPAPKPKMVTFTRDGNGRIVGAQIMDGMADSELGLYDGMIQ